MFVYFCRYEIFGEKENLWCEEQLRLNLNFVAAPLPTFLSFSRSSWSLTHCTGTVISLGKVYILPFLFIFYSFFNSFFYFGKILYV
jgi:hypothetical protein